MCVHIRVVNNRPDRPTWRCIACRTATASWPVQQLQGSYRCVPPQQLTHPCMLCSACRAIQYVPQCTSDDRRGVVFCSAHPRLYSVACSNTTRFLRFSTAAQHVTYGVRRSTCTTSPSGADRIEWMGLWGRSESACYSAAKGFITSCSTAYSGAATGGGYLARKPSSATGSLMVPRPGLGTLGIERSRGWSAGPAVVASTLLIVL